MPADGMMDGSFTAAWDAAALRPLPEEFYARDPREVARDLLGKVLVCGAGSNLRAARLVEVEAYLGLADPASHAYRGPTPRNAVMFGPPGRAYVYLIYGRYFCVNVVCEDDGKAGAVLFRAAEPLAGHRAMARARGETRGRRTGSGETNGRAGAHGNGAGNHARAA